LLTGPAISLLADLERRRDVNEHEAAERFDHPANVPACWVIRGNKNPRNRIAEKGCRGAAGASKHTKLSRRRREQEQTKVI
jgi:transposase-like protein